MTLKNFANNHCAWLITVLFIILMISVFIIMSPTGNIEIWKPNIYGKFGNSNFGITPALVFLSIVFISLLIIIFIYFKYSDT